MHHFTKPKAQCSEPINQVALFKMEVWQVFPPRPHTCGSHQEQDEQNVSKAVSVSIFMEDYTFDLKPTDDKALHNQNNMCIYKPIAAWEAGCFWYFSWQNTFRCSLKLQQIA